MGRSVNQGAAIVAAIAIAALAACSTNRSVHLKGTTTTSGKGSTATPNAAGLTSTTVPRSTTATGKFYVLCLDTTAYPYLGKVVKAVAQELMSDVTPGNVPEQVDVQAISADSLSPAAELMPPIVVPKIPPQPTPPDPNVDIGGTAAYQQAVAYYNSQLAVMRQAGAAAAAQLSPELQQLATLNPPEANLTDIWGCVTQASMILAGAPTGYSKYLVLATDLQEAGPQNVGNIDLQDVTVSVADYDCAETLPANVLRGETTSNIADLCNARQQAFESKITTTYKGTWGGLTVAGSPGSDAAVLP